MLPVAGLALVFAAGCGTKKTDVTAGTADFNKELAPEGSKLDCPKEVVGGEGTVFECTIKGKSGKSVPVQLKVVKKDGDLAVQATDQQAYDTARQQAQGGP
jgi:hypothetical protein